MTLVSVASSVEDSLGSSGSSSEGSSGFVRPSIRKKLSAREKGWEERTEFDHLKEDFKWWKDNFLINYNFIEKHHPQLLTIRSSMDTFVDSVDQMKKIVGKMRRYSKFFEPADWVYFLDCEEKLEEYRGYFHFER